jgi:hypothetical protein
MSSFGSLETAVTFAITQPGEYSDQAKHLRRVRGRKSIGISEQQRRVEERHALEAISISLMDGLSLAAVRARR